MPVDRRVLTKARCSRPGFSLFTVSSAGCGPNDLARPLVRGMRDGCRHATDQEPFVIPFNKPYMTGVELSRIAQAHANGHLSGDGMFTKQCNRWLEKQTGAAKALLTHSCTAAL